jgi:hypothetical protein
LKTREVTSGKDNCMVPRLGSECFLAAGRRDGGLSLQASLSFVWGREIGVRAWSPACGMQCLLSGDRGCGVFAWSDVRFNMPKRASRNTQPCERRIFHRNISPGKRSLWWRGKLPSRARASGILWLVCSPWLLRAMSLDIRQGQ